MKGGFGSLVPKLIGFIVMVITLALAPAIYTANLLVVNYGGGSGLTNFTGMATISDYGGFLVILGLLVTQGIFAIGSLKEGNGGWKDMFGMIAAVIGVIILLNIYASAVLPAFTSLIASASVATDTIGQTVFGVLPIVIYLGIVIGAAGFNIAKEVGRRKGKKGSRSMAASYA